MTRRRHTLVTAAALLLGLALLAVALVRADLGSLGALAWQLGAALPLALLPSAAWHLLRTSAWAHCFPVDTPLSFARLARVRLAAEAFSYVTIRGVAGEPLKVVLLEREVTPAISAAAVALERLAYLLTTAAIVGLAATIALIAVPLSREWTIVFSIIAAVAIVITAVPLVLLRRRPAAELVATVPRPSAPSSSSSPSRSGARAAISRFVRELERQSRALVHGDRRRLGRVIALEGAAYVMMALEVWVVLWAAGMPIGAVAAVTVETFTRVASMVSAFIPANLGALEASHVAAAAAVHAAGGAAALALVRRLRGLLWCAAGFLVYPRLDGRRLDSRRGVRQARSRHARPPAAGVEREDDTGVLVVIEATQSEVTLGDHLGGLPIGERMLRAAARAGYRRLLVWSPHQRAAWQALDDVGIAAVTAVDDPPRWRAALAELRSGTPVTVLGPGTIPSPALLEAARTVSLEQAPGHIADDNRPIVDAADIRADVEERADSHHQPIVEIPAGREWPRSGVFRTTAAHLLASAMPPWRPAASDDTTCERLPGVRDRAAAVRDEPTGRDVAAGRAALSLHVITRRDLAAAERLLRESIFKPTDAYLARFNRRLSIPLSVGLIRLTRLSPHVMTVFLIALGFLAGWLFSRGSYAAGVLAAVVSLAASILDGCDGELARLQHKESAFGCWLDTLGDYSYYLAIFSGLGVGVVREEGLSTGWMWVGGALLAGVLLTFGLLILLRRRITAGRPEQLRTVAEAHVAQAGSRWVRLMSRLSTCATRASMPYGILLFAVAGALPWLLVLAAVSAQVYWISLALELRRLLDRSHTAAPDSMQPTSRLA